MARRGRVDAGIVRRPIVPQPEMGDAPAVDSDAAPGTSADAGALSGELGRRSKPSTNLRCATTAREGTPFGLWSSRRWCRRKYDEPGGTSSEGLLASGARKRFDIESSSSEFSSGLIESRPACGEELASDMLAHEQTHAAPSQRDREGGSLENGRSRRHHTLLSEAPTDRTARTSRREIDKAGNPS